MLMSMSLLSINLSSRVKQALFPNVCPLCAKHQEDEHGCCERCLQSISIMPQHVCQSCGIPLNPSLAPGPCGQCLRKPLPQQQTHHLYLYQDVVRDAILAWKLQGQDIALNFLLQAAEPQLQHIFSKHDLLLPVPMPMYRMRRSGLHHSADLCQKIVHATGANMDWQILRRKGVHQRQSSLHGKARQRNLHRAFRLSGQALSRLDTYPEQGKIWVVDDILTTGATLRHACQVAKQLKRPIFAFSFARTWHENRSL